MGEDHAICDKHTSHDWSLFFLRDNRMPESEINVFPSSSLQAPRVSPGQRAYLAFQEEEEVMVVQVYLEVLEDLEPKVRVQLVCFVCSGESRQHKRDEESLYYMFPGLPGPPGLDGLNGLGGPKGLAGTPGKDFSTHSSNNLDMSKDTSVAKHPVLTSTLRAMFYHSKLLFFITSNVEIKPQLSEVLTLKH